MVTNESGSGVLASSRRAIIYSPYKHLGGTNGPCGAWQQAASFMWNGRAFSGVGCASGSPARRSQRR